MKQKSMSNSTTEQNIVELVSTIVKRPVDGESSAENMPEWDSLAQMKIIIELERAYEIEVEDEWIAKLNSVATIVSYLEDRIS